jgi:rhodanese-related sulfurtransferase
VEKECVALGKEGDYTATSRKGANNLMAEDISREELKVKMGRGEDFVLLEVLPEKSYRRSHLPGAINLPPGQTDQAEELIPHKEAEVVVYCASPP